MATRPALPAARPAMTLLALALGLAMAMPVLAQESTAAGAGDTEARATASDAASVDSQPDATAPQTDVPDPPDASSEAPIEPAAETTPADPAATDAAPVDDADDAVSSSAERADKGADAEASTDTTAGVAEDPSASETPPVDPTDATDAESDFDVLYGDATTGEAPPAAFDPWERYNRTMHRFNNAVDRRVAQPLAKAYVRAVPAPVRGSVSNFFSNLGQPVSAVNALLQGRPKQAAHSAGRFLLNSTLGIGGLFDPASAAKLQNRNEDFGQTLGVWGWKRSRYVELPLFGPRTLRDVVGMAGDAPLSPLRQIDADKIRAPLQGLQLVDLRMQLLSTDALREGVEDDYALVRDAWSQRRAYQISGDRDDGVPDYLREEPTVVPVDAMPVTLPGG